MHKYEKTPDTQEPGVGKIKHWKCLKCGCEKELANYRFASPMYVRSGVIYDYSPECTEMGRRSNESLD